MRISYFGYIKENLRRNAEASCIGETKATSSSSKCSKSSSSSSSSNATTFDYVDSSEVGSSFHEDERFNPAKTYQPGPLKMEIKSIKNSTSYPPNSSTSSSSSSEYLPVDMSNFILNGDNESEGRAFVTAAVLLSGIIFWSWKAFLAFIFVHGFDYIWTKFKYLLGYSRDSYETYITIGHDNNHHQHRKDDHHDHKGHHHHDHHHHHPHGGWPAPHHSHHHHHGHRTVHKAPFPWYHPATKLFEQPTIQYSPWGKEYQLLAFDQRQAFKYRNKYDRKLAKYKQKYYYKKGKEIRKAERQKMKAERKKEKAARRKKKYEAFRERLKDWFNLPERKKKGEDDDDDDDDDGDDEENADLVEKKERNKKKKKNWKESSSDMEHGEVPPPHPPPQLPPRWEKRPPHSYYKPGENYDPTPVFGDPHTQHLRIRG